MNIKFTFLILVLMFSPRLFGQDANPKLLQVVPPSPNVAALGKYGDVPVSLYTGIPNISIPLYEIKDGPLNLPISLSYHAGGVKVEEMASSVGLGWALNAGGIIGRSIRGLPDEFGWQPQAPSNTIENIYASNNSTQINQMVKDVQLGFRDGEPDSYYYNFNQYSGKFIYTQSGSINTISSKNLLITAIGDSWKITTEDGIVYSFTKSEEVSSANCGGDQITTTAWYLSSIKSSDGSREIKFTYDAISYTYTTLIGQTKYFSANGTGGSCLSNAVVCLGTQNYRTHRLSRIDFGSGYLTFSYNNTRCDLVDDKSLDEISIYSLTNELLKKYSLAHSYFGNNNSDCNRLNETSKRLKLTSVTEKNGITQKPPYLFEYNESVILPDRLSYDQDHWGYYNYNGQAHNQDMIATFTIIPPATGQPITYLGANRKTNELAAQAAVLTKMKYPTGGETLFTFESNTVSDNYTEYDVTEQSMILSASHQPVRNLPTPFESNQLVIPASGAYVNFRGITGLYPYWQDCDIVQCVVIKDNNPAPFRQIADNLNGGREFWPAGAYKLRLTTECSIDAVANFTANVTVEIPVSQSFDTRAVGGLRIKKTEDKAYAVSPSIIKNYKYNKDGDAIHSSGILVNNPDYGYSLNVQSITTDGFGHYMLPIIVCDYRVRQSFSNYPLATTQGGYVGYSHVVVDLNGDGESRYFFDAHEDIAGAFPFPPIENYDWRRGFLLKTQDYISRNGQLVLAREVANTSVKFNQKMVFGVKTGADQMTLIDGIRSPEGQPVVKYSVYPVITEFFDIGKTSEKVYDQNDVSRFIEKTTDYTYSTTHLQKIQSKTTTSSIGSGGSIEEVFVNIKYPFDYSFTGAPSGTEALGIKKLQDLHVVNAIVEQSSGRQTRSSSNVVSNQRIISSMIQTFKSDKPYLDKMIRLETSSSIPIAAYNGGSALLSNAFVSSSNSAINNSFKPAVYFKSYDNMGNILTQQKDKDLLETYLWGYRQQYPVAKIIGKSYDDVLSQSGIDLSVVNNLATGDLAMRTELNKLRLLNGCFVTTYTYKLLTGITSETDPSGKTIYYEYDAFNRLKLIRDKDGNILKSFQYKYQEQQ